MGQKISVSFSYDGKDYSTAIDSTANPEFLRGVVDCAADAVKEFILQNKLKSKDGIWPTNIHIVIDDQDSRISLENFADEELANIENKKIKKSLRIDLNSPNIKNSIKLVQELQDKGFLNQDMLLEYSESDKEALNGIFKNYNVPFDL